MCSLKKIFHLNRLLVPHHSRIVMKNSSAGYASDTPKTEKTVNQVTLLGRVGADPQKRGNEKHPVVNFSLATQTSYKYESGDILQKTDWHRISVFKPSLREVVYTYLKKGQRVYVTGKISYGEIKMDDGQIRTASTIIAEDVIFLHSQPNLENTDF